MESTLQYPALVAAKNTLKAKTIVYWTVTALFCLQMSFTAYAQLRLPQLADVFTHLGFPDYFRGELSWANLLGVVLAAATGLLWEPSYFVWRPVSCKKNVVFFLAWTGASECNKPLSKRYLAGSMAMGGGGPSPRWILPIWELVRQSIPRCIAGRTKASFEG